MDFVDGFYEGARELAARVGCDVVGGDLSSSPNGIFVDVACYGETDQAILRSGAKPGDLVAVSGTPGASAAGLHSLKTEAETTAALRKAHLRPEPRFDALTSSDFSVHCTSLIDVSDGLASELGHLAKNSNVGFEIMANSIPLHPDALAGFGRERSLEWALHGGEDYELLATFMPGAPIPPGFTVIGRATPAAEGMTMVQADGTRRTLRARGYDHFSS